MRIIRKTQLKNGIASPLARNDRLEDVVSKVERGERLNFEDGVRLFHSQDIHTIGHLANIVRERKNENRAYYILNRHINYTNICKNRCKFCAFSRDRGEDGAYVMGMEEILDKAEDVIKEGSTEIHIVGGLHPELKFDYYVKMLGELHHRYPEVHLQAFTAVEIAHLAEVSNLTVRSVLRELKAAGLGSLPGGGAEVFSPRIREQVCPEKLSGDGWLNVMRHAHELGLRSNATMLYGHVETAEDRINHLLKLRELQDETGGFMSFIPLAFHPKNTELGWTSLQASRGIRLRRTTSPTPVYGTTAMLDLKMLAIGRLMLDNFDHVKAFWIMLGVKLAQVSLSFGVDDIDGTVVEEKITHSAGADTPESLTVNEIVGLIKEAGREPVERDTLYRVVSREVRPPLNPLLRKEGIMGRLGCGYKEI